MVEPAARRVLRGNVGDFREIAKTELARANRKHHFFRIAGLENRSPTIENYIKILQRFQELDVVGDSDS